MSNRHCELYRFLSIENKGAHYFDTSESCERDGRRDLSWDMSSVSMNGHQQARNALLASSGHSDLYLRYRVITFDRFLGEFRGKLELQTFLYRYGSSCPFVNSLDLITVKAEYISLEEGPPRS